MSKSPITIARTIANALNMTFHTHVVINQNYFHKSLEGRPIRMYVVKDSYYEPLPFRKYWDKELFRTASAIYTCLFLRDLLWAFQGKVMQNEPNEGYKKIFLDKELSKSIDYMLDRYKGGDRF